MNTFLSSIFLELVDTQKELLNKSLTKEEVMQGYQGFTK